MSFIIKTNQMKITELIFVLNIFYFKLNLNLILGFSKTVAHICSICVYFPKMLTH